MELSSFKSVGSNHGRFCELWAEKVWYFRILWDARMGLILDSKYCDFDRHSGLQYSSSITRHAIYYLILFGFESNTNCKLELNFDTAICVFVYYRRIIYDLNFAPNNLKFFSQQT